MSFICLNKALNIICIWWWCYLMWVFTVIKVGFLSFSKTSLS